MRVSDNGHMGSEDVARWAGNAEPIAALAGKTTPIERIDMYGNLAGCALHTDGHITCWDQHGQALADAHPADGRATGLAFVDFPPWDAGMCAVTGDAILCADEYGDSWSLDAAGASGFDADTNQACAIVDDTLVCHGRFVADAFRQVRGVAGATELFSVGDGFCATTTGGLVCWGLPFHPRFPDGSSGTGMPYPEPTVVRPGVERAWIDANGWAWCLDTGSGPACEGRSTMCADVDGRVTCKTPDGERHPAARLQNVTEVHNSGNDGCLIADGVVHCWDYQHVLTKVDTTETVVSIDSGSLYGVALLEDGRIVKRGDTLDLDRSYGTGASLDGTSDGWCTTTAERVRCNRWGNDGWAFEGAVAALASGGAVCALRDDGTVWCRGNPWMGGTGQLWSAERLYRLAVEPERGLEPWSPSDTP